MEISLSVCVNLPGFLGVRASGLTSITAQDHLKIGGGNSKFGYNPLVKLCFSNQFTSNTTINFVDQKNKEKPTKNLRVQNDHMSKKK